MREKNNKFIWSRAFASEENGRLVSNFFSLVFLQGANYILPLLTLPFLVQVLGAEKFGMIAFAQAIVGYFIVLTDYGFNLSATKEISIHKDDHQKVSQTFCTILFIKIVFMFIGFLIFYLIVEAIEQDSSNKIVYFFSYGVVLGQVLFPAWFFQGVEKMKYITFINILSKVIFTVLIFAFVHNQQDYVRVPAITSLGYIVGGVFSLVICFRSFNIKLAIPSIQNIKQELNNGFSIFLTSVSSNIISSSGVLVLGLYHSKEIVGYFSAIEKLSKVFVSVFNPITQAIFPHVSYQFSISSKAGKAVIFRFGKYTMMLVSLIVLFVVVLNEPLVNLIYGATFTKYAYLLNYFGIWLFFGVLNNFIGVQFLVGSGKSKVYSKAFAVASACTLTAFVLFTKQYSYIAVIGGILAGEIILTLLMLLYIYRLKLLK